MAIEIYKLLQHRCSLSQMHARCTNYRLNLTSQTIGLVCTHVSWTRIWSWNVVVKNNCILQGSNFVQVEFTVSQAELVWINSETARVLHISRYNWVNHIVGCFHCQMMSSSQAREATPAMELLMSTYRKFKPSKPTNKNLNHTEWINVNKNPSLKSEKWDRWAHLKYIQGIIQNHRT